MGRHHRGTIGYDEPHTAGRNNPSSPFQSLADRGDYQMSGLLVFAGVIGLFVVAGLVVVRLVHWALHV
jgi:hypothetical protein